MATKEAKKRMKMCALKKHKLKETVPISWRTVSRHAPSIEKMFHANQDVSWFRQPCLPSQNILSSS
jgi:hypothetical protein